MAEVVDMKTRRAYLGGDGTVAGGPPPGDDQLETRVKILEERASRVEGKIDTLIEKVARMEGEIHRLPGYPGLFVICGTLVGLVALIVRFLPAPPA